VPKDTDTIFARLVLEHEFVTQEQLDEVIAAQKAGAEALGVGVPLAQLLVSKGLLSKDQSQEIRNAAAIETGEARMVGDYEVISRLGAGTMGAVYEARSVRTGERVALKILPPSLASSGMIARFKRESAVAAKLDHPNIVGFIEFGQDPKRGAWFCALELIRGQDLDKYVEQNGILDEKDACRIAHHIALGLQHACENGLVHRDVKPHNVMLTADGGVKLLDLGLARHTDVEDDRHTQAGLFVGSPAYAAPEQVSGGDDVDTRTDIYGLGATLYHLVTGGPPFSGPTVQAILKKQVNEEVPWPASVNPDLSESFCNVLMKMMEKNPRDRYQTPADAASDLLIVMEGGEVAWSGSGRPRRKASTSKRRTSSSARARGKAQTGSSTRIRAAQRKSGSRTIPVVLGAAGVVLVLVIALVNFGGSTPPPPETENGAGNVTVGEQDGEDAAPSEPTPVAPSPETDGTGIADIPDASELVIRPGGTPPRVAGRDDTPPPPAGDAPGPAVTQPLPPRPSTVPADAVEHGGHFYKVYEGRKRWHDAKRFCEDRGGHLMVITSNEEQSLAVEMLRRSGGDSAWIGLTEEGHLGDWRWVTGEPLNYQGWARGEPNNWKNKGEHWATLMCREQYRGQYGWSDNTMGSVQNRGLICEWEGVTRAPDVAVAAAPAPEIPKVENVFAGFDAAMAKCDYAAAGRSADAAAKDPANATHAKALRSASSLARALSKLPEACVEGAGVYVGSEIRVRLKRGSAKGKLLAVSDDGLTLITIYVINNKKRERKRALKWSEIHAEQLDKYAKIAGVKLDPTNRAIANAYEALASKDRAKARSALRSAGAHPLAPHVKTRVAELDPARREALEEQKRRALAGSWTPAQIKTTLWLDAADKTTITLVGDAVSRWRDKSGNNKHAMQPVSENRPRYRASDAMLGGRPSVGVDLEAKWLEIPPTPARRIYMVLYYGDGTEAVSYEHSAILSSTGQNGEYRITGGSRSPLWNDSRNFNDAGTYRNGSTMSDLTALPMPATLWRFDSSFARNQPWKVLIGNNPTWARYKGAIGELIFTDGREGLSEQRRIEGYLAHKWGIQANLPANHPHRRGLASAGHSSGTSVAAKPPARGGQGLTGYAKAVLADRPVVYYDLNEAYAARAVRNSGSGGAAWDGFTTGRAVFGARGASKALGTALDLSGRNEGYITTGRNISDILNNTSSMEFWIKTTQSTDGTWRAASIAGQDYNKGPDIWWGMNYYGKIGIMVGKPDTGAFAGPVNDGRWHYVLMTFDRPAGMLRVYLDGNPAAASTFSLAGDKELNEPFVMTYNRIGHGDPRQGKKVDAVIDEVAIYDRVLSGAVGRAHYEAAGAARPSGGDAREPTRRPPEVSPEKESQARAAWRAIEAMAREGGLGPEKRQALRQAVETFEQRFGGTEYAASIAENIAKLKSLLR